MSNVHAPPSTNKKKKALRVFGDVVAVDEFGSLNYSLSTDKSNVSSGSSSTYSVASINTMTDSRNGNAVTESSFVSRTGNSGFAKDFDLESVKENVILTTTVEKLPPRRSITTESRIASIGSGVRTARHPTRSPLRRDLVKQTQDAINKASASVKNTVDRAVMVVARRSVDRKNINSRCDRKAETAEALEFNQKMEQNRREILLLQRQLWSKVSKEKAHQMCAYRNNNRQLVDKESQFKSAVFREHQEKLKQEKYESRRRSVEARARLRTNYQSGEQKMVLERIEEERAIFEERHESSLAQRVAAQKKAAKRRESFSLRNGDARRIRAIHAAEEAEKQLQQHKSFELQRQANLDVDEYKSQMAQARRASLAQRNLKGLDDRQWEEEQHQNTLTAQHASYELEWAADMDAESYRQRMASERRQSLAMRNVDGKRQRDLMERQRSETMQKQHESVNLKWDGERDAHNYLLRVESDRRKSLEQRNQAARAVREKTREKASDSFSLAQKSSELERLAHKDVEDYKKHQELRRRESLSRHNKKRIEHAEVMAELESLAREKETESYVLKCAGENDANAYHDRLAEERRQSLQLRGKQVVHNRQIEIEQRDGALAQAHQDEAMRADDKKDVEQYRKECNARDRKSFEYRRKEARMFRIQQDEDHVAHRQAEEESNELESMARKDVERYVKDCTSRRRMSLAVRAKEKRDHAKWLQKEKERALQTHQHMVYDRLMDQRHIELARQQERARLAMDAIRHAGCSFNPFAGLL